MALLQVLRDAPLHLIHSTYRLRQRPWIGYAIAALLCMGAYWSSRMGAGIQPWPFLIHTVAVIVATVLGGIRVGLFAALAALAVVGYFFIEPSRGWQLQWPYGWLTMLVFAMILLLLLGAMQALFDSLRYSAAQRLGKEQLRRRQKMEALGQLTGGIVHDFNNMLAIVAASLEMTRKRLADPVDPRVAQYLDHANEGVQRAAELTSRLLAFARRRPTAPEPVDANSLVTNLARLLQHTLGAKIKVETRLADDLSTVFVDPAQLESALVNLAINSRDAMPEGGTLTLSTANASDFDPAGGCAGHSYVVIQVADTGTGMSIDVARHALDPFFTTKPDGKGTGLGLSQVHDCVQQSAGHLRIDTAPGRGTRISIYLPRHTEATETEARTMSVTAG